MEIWYALDETEPMKVLQICKQHLAIVSQHIERDQLSQKIKLTFWYFLNGCSFISSLVQKFVKSDTAFLIYGNFIEDVITDW